MKKINHQQLKQLVEATIFVAQKPVSESLLRDTVLSGFSVSDRALSKVLKELHLDYQPRGIQLVKVAGGYRFQSLDSLSPFLSLLWQESAPKYSRAMMETLALIAYRQPITRGEIEQIRGVAVSSNIMRTLTERGWVRSVGHKEVPGRPALYATTTAFLDYFSLASLAELPSADAFDALAQQHTDQGKANHVLTEAT
ncbi:SMC-Scp complex subunit ScpB [Alteromonas ponticola]|uniref:SMC-Scp complex subunit ScpB n=1 Tax=Alteromonas aquimaris TaxID=2998417 RepID=A0ABT3P573_9ALTE|nr:SMC-Scp complex subunit ScpB [Alteromonas aquimaris]MCW8107921.1 SMC-Scp complex subunit ScpB [Alteromonas aquimaris]